MPAEIVTTPAPTDTTLKKWRRYAVILGALLALVCKTLPHDYQAPCAALAQFCTGG